MLTAMQHTHNIQLSARAWRSTSGRWNVVSAPLQLENGDSILERRKRISRNDSKSLNSQIGGDTCTVRPLQYSQSLAWSRHHESQQPQPLFVDPYAHQLASIGPLEVQQQSELSRVLDIIATKYIDETLMNALAITNVNTINRGDYRQVVLVGDGMDTRPYRLLWPPGTVLFSLAPSEAHELAEAVLRQQGAHMARGCLLRRVNACSQGSSKGGYNSFLEDLERAGFRGDRLSIWVLQGLQGLDLSHEQLQALLADVCNCAAFNSLVLGELPPLQHQQAQNLLADAGLLATVVDFGTPETSYGRWHARLRAELDQQVSSSDLAAMVDDEDGTPSGQAAAAAAAAASGTTAAAAAAAAPPPVPAPAAAAAAAAGASGRKQRWLFAAQQMRLSFQQMGVYDAHVKEAEATDEDFFGNFS